MRKRTHCSCRTAIESFISTNPNSPIKRRVIIVCLWFFTTLIGAVFLPNISLAIHYLGALAASFIFIFPGTFFSSMIISPTYISFRSLSLLPYPTIMDVFLAKCSCHIHRNILCCFGCVCNCVNISSIANGRY